MLTRWGELYRMRETTTTKHLKSTLEHYFKSKKCTKSPRSNLKNTDMCSLRRSIRTRFPFVLGFGKCFLWRGSK